MAADISIANLVSPVLSETYVCLENRAVVGSWGKEHF